MKKVLIAITTLYGGGAERVVSLWANALYEKGVDVSLLIYGRSENEYPIHENIKIHTVAENYKQYQQMGYIQRLKRMRSIVKTVRPDVVINFLPRMQIWMMFATWFMKLRRIETVRISPWQVAIRRKSEAFLWKMCFSRSSDVIIQTAEQGEFFSKKVQKKCCVIPNPIGQQYIDCPKTEYGQRACRFMAAGRITKQKNYPMMIKAFRILCDKYPDAKLSVFGTGDQNYINVLQELIHQLNLEKNVTLEGRSNCISEELRCRDVFLMTSDFEGMPNALAEAMATGLVCVSTDCRTGPKDMLKHRENGFLVPVGDVENLAAVMTEIVQMDSRAMEKMGKAARESILDMCSEEKSLKKLMELIEK